LYKNFFQKSRLKNKSPGVSISGFTVFSFLHFSVKTIFLLFTPFFRMLRPSLRNKKQAAAHVAHDDDQTHHQKPSPQLYHGGGSENQV
jgi:hypothetical protein